MQEGGRYHDGGQADRRRGDGGGASPTNGKRYAAKAWADCAADENRRAIGADGDRGSFWHVREESVLLRRYR